MSEHASILREPWPSVPRQREGVAFGMWSFLATEVLFFGALLLVYAVYRDLYPDAFRDAARETDVVYGTVNTLLLLTSSFVMTLAVDAGAAGARRLTVILLCVTAALGTAFMIVKGFEYYEDIDKSLLPDASLPLPSPMSRLFFALYWVMTGVHAIHLAIGIGFVLVMAVLLGRSRLPPQSPALDVAALYWHFVDTVWVLLFALIYLPGRS